MRSACSIVRRTRSGVRGIRASVRPVSRCVHTRFVGTGLWARLGYRCASVIGPRYVYSNVQLGIGPRSSTELGFLVDRAVDGAGGGSLIVMLTYLPVENEVPTATEVRSTVVRSGSNVGDADRSVLETERPQVHRRDDGAVRVHDACRTTMHFDSRRSRRRRRRSAEASGGREAVPSFASTQTAYARMAMAALHSARTVHAWVSLR